ncbi:hypothetical protein V6N13_088425 [Hibiscus sabdariffa]
MKQLKLLLLSKEAWEGLKVYPICQHICATLAISSSGVRCAWTRTSYPVFHLSSMLVQPLEHSSISLTAKALPIGNPLLVHSYGVAPPLLMDSYCMLLQPVVVGSPSNTMWFVSTGHLFCLSVYGLLTKFQSSLYV